jgi:uncharacterized protein (DUF1800 family)
MAAEQRRFNAPVVDCRQVAAGIRLLRRSGAVGSQQQSGTDAMRLSRKAAQRAHFALQRFGLGPRPGTIDRIGDDPVAALLAELRTPGIARLSGPGLPSYEEAARQSQLSFEAAHQVFRREVDARIDKQLDVDIGFVERLVMFWSNHFSMSVNKCEAVRGTLGQLERDVIRRHVLGNFTDMLVGVMTHPAMIAFLDNADSVGPSTEVAKWWDAGFNENLAREIMELHTIGSDGGYTEEDVTNLSQILTGWSYVRWWESDNGWNGGTQQNRGQFIFRDDWHEPGSFKLMGKRYGGKGMEAGLAVLRDLAAMPQTAENIAFKLVRHFYSDEPDPRMVARVARVFRKTGGNLRAVATALVRDPDALEGQLVKIRTPYENAIAQFRAVGRRYDEDNHWSFWCTLDALKGLPFECPSPEGYADETAAWLAPDAMTIRLDTALLNAWVYAKPDDVSATTLARRLFGKALRKESLRKIAGAPDAWRAYATLFMIPEFQRR